MDKINRDAKVVKILADYNKGVRNESTDIQETTNLIADQASNPTPHNKYLLAQLVGFTVTELIKPSTDWLEKIADVKRIGLGDKAQFKVKYDGIQAVLQAKNATTLRSRIGNKAFTMDTMEISARPTVNLVDLQSGVANMNELITEATLQINNKIAQAVEAVLLEGVTGMESPYYATGAGLIKATLDLQIRHWMRYGGAAILGDIAAISKISELTGFAQNTTDKSFSNNIINEHNSNGHIGRYIGADVVQLVNPYLDGKNTVLKQGNLYILPTGLDADGRALKVAFEGDVQAMEASNIDDKSYEIRLDQYFGAGLVYGKSPNMSVYNDSTLK